MESAAGSSKEPAIDPEEAARRLEARFRELGIPAPTIAHDPVFTVGESRGLQDRAPGGHCKNLFLRDRKRDWHLLVTLEDCPINLAELAPRIGAKRLSFASGGDLWRILGVTPGSVSPFGLIQDVACVTRVWLQRAMLDHDPLHYHPLRNDRTTAISPHDLERFIRSCGHEPQVLDLPGA